MIARVKRFIGEARQEFRHVNWPTRQEATRLTAVVIGLSLLLAVFLGTFDFALSTAIQAMISQF